MRTILLAVFLGLVLLFGCVGQSLPQSESEPSNFSRTYSLHFKDIAYFGFSLNNESGDSVVSSGTLNLSFYNGTDFLGERDVSIVPSDFINCSATQNGKMIMLSYCASKSFSIPKEWQESWDDIIVNGTFKTPNGKEFSTILKQVEHFEHSIS